MPVHYVRDFSSAMDGPKQSDDHRDGHQAINKNYQVMQDLFPAREEKNGLIREVGSVATWSLSSSKAGFGVDQLRDESMDTFWQSDGPQPHLVNITFARKTTIKYVCLYIDYNADESYTPYKLSIRAGNCFTDLQEVEQIEMDKPSGWVVITLRDGNDMPIRAFHLQIAILGNHQNGRDTHLRHVKVYSPANNTNISALGHMENDFSTTCLSQHAVLR